MALIRFFVLCLVTIHVSCSVTEDDNSSEDTELAPRFFFNKLCSEDNIINPSNSKIVCLLCTRFDRSCFDATPSRTSTSETPTSTTSEITHNFPTKIPADK